MENSKTIRVSFKGKTAELQQLPNGKWVCTNIGEFTTLGSSVTWLDDCRVPTAENTERAPSLTDWEGGYSGGHEKNGGHEAGRFPANLLVENSVLDTITCTCTTREGDIQIVPQDLNADADGTEATTLHADQLPKNENAEYPKPSKVNGSPQNTEPRSPLHASLFTTSEDANHTEAPTATALTDDGCEPSESETETSASNAKQPKTSILTTSSRTPASQNSSTKSATGASCALHAIGKLQPTESNQQYSRFFSLDAWAQTLPFLAVPKASKREKNEGLDGMPVKNNHRVHAPRESEEAKTSSLSQNHHPTVKPLKLMSYLITLGSREGDVVLDPFLGSGTTCIAAKQLGRQYIGIEREQEYMDIAEARLKAVQNTLL